MSSHFLSRLLLTTALAATALGCATSKPPIAPAASAIAAAPALPPPEKILDTLRPTHPRVMATREDFQTIRKQAATNAELARWVAALRTEANALLSPAGNSKPEAKPVLWNVSAGRRVLQHRIYLLGMLYQLTDDKRYAESLWGDLAEVMALPDWAPDHFLDTAEFSSALGIAYDWLYDAWTPEQRRQLLEAIINKGLKPGLAVYRIAASGGPSDARYDGWPKVRHNWNQVCNGGLLMGALAIAGPESEPARDIVHSALSSLPLALNEYAPDGGWAEGPGYWGYATEYTVYALASLQTALGTDFGLSAKPGLSLTGDFRRHFTGPTNFVFNYADCSMGPFAGYSPLFWMATAFHAPRLAARQMPFAEKKTHPLDLLWGARWVLSHPVDAPQPLARYFRGHEVVTMRSAWDDPRALFVGFKGGDNKANHSHLDLGSFVFDALGQRWAYDLGGDDYALPQYFHQRRWTYYRLRAEGHNTLVINPGAWPDQDPRATARVARFSDAPDRPFAIVDLSDAYSGDAHLARRGIRLIGNSHLIIQDEVTCDSPPSPLYSPGDLWWFMHTAATIQCDGATAQLTRGGERLTARILEPAGARFEDLPAKPLPSNPNPAGQMLKKTGGAPDEPMHKLSIHLPGVHGNLRLVVVLTPQTQSPAPPYPPVIPLDKWE